MNAENLAAIFQPGLISHPSHEMAPLAYRLSQDVLIFLINHQDHFLLGMRGSNDADGVPQLNLPVTATNQSGIARSGSGSSIGADDVRKFGSLRRNASVSSKKSGGPVTTRSGGVSRSNTLPSKRSPRPRPSASFRPVDGSGSPRPADSIPNSPLAAMHARVPSPVSQMMENLSPVEPPPRSAEGLGLMVREPRSRQVSGSSFHSRQYSEPPAQKPPLSSPGKDRSFANRFSLGADTEKPQRKLQKKRLPGSSDHSAESSNVSLPGPASPSFEHTVPATTPIPIMPPQPAHRAHHHSHSAYSGATAGTSLMMPTMSPTPSATSSVTSQDSMHSYSDATNASTTAEKRKKAKSRWRWSNSKVDEWQPQSPTFGGSTGSIAEVMRRTSQSPPADDRRKLSSDFSGDDESSGSKARATLSWLRRRGAGSRGASPEGRREGHVHMPQPGSPQVQPPTPSTLASTPIEEETRTLEGDVMAPPVQQTVPDSASSAALAGKQTPESETTPKASPQSDMTIHPETENRTLSSLNIQTETTPRESQQLYFTDDAEYAQIVPPLKIRKSPQLGSPVDPSAPARVLPASLVIGRPSTPPPAVPRHGLPVLMSPTRVVPLEDRMPSSPDVAMVSRNDDFNRMLNGAMVNETEREDMVKEAEV